MKHSNLQPKGRSAAASHGSATLDETCRESLDDLKNGRVESLDAYIDTLKARLKDLRTARAK